VSDKQDRQGVRTASQLEQKYQFGKKFSEILGIATDAREKVDSVTSELRNEITENYTSIVRDTEKIIMSALKNYSKTEDTQELEQTLRSELTVMAEKIALDFEAQRTEISNVDGETKRIDEDLRKHFDFDVNGLTIKAGESQIKLRIDNDMIAFYYGDIDENDLSKNRFGMWDGVNFHTGNIYVAVDETAQFGNYGFVPYFDYETDGLDLVRVGG
jgi:gas vesicle protein